MFYNHGSTLNVPSLLVESNYLPSSRSQRVLPPDVDIRARIQLPILLSSLQVALTPHTLGPKPLSQSPAGMHNLMIALNYLTEATSVGPELSRVPLNWRGCDVSAVSATSRCWKLWKVHIEGPAGDWNTTSDLSFESLVDSA